MCRNDDPVAERARRCIEATLGVEVECWDKEGHQGRYDLRYADAGRVVAVEVKRVMKQSYREAGHVASKFGYMTDERLSRSWHLRLDPNARWTEVRELVPPLLRRFEVTGTEYWPLSRLQQVDPPMYQQLQACKVVYLSSHPPTDTRPPGYELELRAWSDFPGGMDDLLAFACEKLASEDREMARLRGQLRDADADERHAFLVMEIEHLGPWSLLRSSSAGLPSCPPELPPPIDGLWLTSASPDPRLIAWLPQRGWLNGTVTQP